MSMLGRAAKKYDTAFAALPADVQRDLAIFGVRSIPLLRRLAEIIGPAFDNAKVREATSDVLVALAFRLVKTMSLDKALSATALNELTENAPHFAGLIRQILDTGLQPAAPQLQLERDDQERLPP